MIDVKNLDDPDDAMFDRWFGAVRLSTSGLILIYIHRMMFGRRPCKQCRLELVRCPCWSRSQILVVMLRGKDQPRCCDWISM
jgi:hypothetical protein